MAPSCPHCYELSRWLIEERRERKAERSRSQQRLREEIASNRRLVEEVQALQGRIGSLITRIGQLEDRG